MKCSVVGCPNEAIFRDEATEALKKTGIKRPNFCYEHRNSQNKLALMHEQIQNRKKKPTF
jgi:ABC-type uncharacterized transport system substrate-binding protein